MIKFPERTKSPVVEFFADIKYYLVNYWYIFRSKYIKKYHIVDIRDSRFDYTSGYCDPVEKIMLATFKIFCDFIEQENPTQVVDQEEEGPWREAHLEMNAIYDWLTVGRMDARNRQSYLFNNFENTDWPVYEFVKSESEFYDGEKLFEMRMTREAGPYCKEYDALEEEIKRKDKDALDRIIKIREFLWT